MLPNGKGRGSGLSNSGINISPAQLTLSFQHDREFLVALFEKTAGVAVRLVLTDNSSSMLSVRREGAAILVRLHRIFLGADEATLRELALFVRHGKGTLTLFRAFINDMRGSIRRKPPRSLPVRTRGKYYDLDDIFRRLNREYFEGKIASVITWGAGSSRRAARKRTLGSYNNISDVIRINPLLDKSTVPPYYVEFIVYHEMLHAAIGIHRKNGRLSAHTRDFRARERLFREYDRALRWEKARSS